MKKCFKKLLIVLLMLIILIGCTNSEKKWPTDISYVPNIPYMGVGKIVDLKEDTSLGKQYTIYIKGATLKSTNEYIDKLYDNHWELLYIYGSEGNHLKQPEENNSHKLGFQNSDNTINAIVTLENKKGEYNLIITFANMEG